jgi:hypothetical protein
VGVHRRLLHRLLHATPLDPQEVGLAILTGQRGRGGPSLGAPTRELSGRVHSVWSQGGPKRSSAGGPARCVPLPGPRQMRVRLPVCRCGYGGCRNGSQIRESEALRQVKETAISRHRATPAQFRRDASVKQLAREYGVAHTTLYWVLRKSECR